jgi:hypothetical protein
MDRLERILNNIKNLDYVKVLVATLNYRVVKNYIIFLNTENQLRLGLDAKSEQLGYYMDPEYAALKVQAGGKAPLGVYDLHVTGDYFKTFIVEVLSNGDFVIDSDTEKPDRDLRDIVRNPFEIEGLNDNSLTLLSNYILPIFINETNKEIYK